MRLISKKYFRAAVNVCGFYFAKQVWKKILVLWPLISHLKDQNCFVVRSRQLFFTNTLCTVEIFWNQNSNNFNSSSSMQIFLTYDLKIKNALLNDEFCKNSVVILNMLTDLRMDLKAEFVRTFHNQISPKWNWITCQFWQVLENFPLCAICILFLIVWLCCYCAYASCWRWWCYLCEFTAHDKFINGSVSIWWGSKWHVNSARGFIFKLWCCCVTWWTTKQTRQSVSSAS